jgi:hypothetical protein
LFVLSCSVLLVLHQTALLYTAYSGHDQAWYLIAAGRVLNGARLYGPYVSDTNPPMIVWFSALPVLLSRVVPLSPTACLRLVVLALWITSAAWCMRVLRHAVGMESPLVRAVITLGILYVGLRMDPREFGQREHLFVVFALPYLFAVGTGAVERLSLAERCALGGMAGLAVCFKPQYALAFAAAEIVLAMAGRTLRRLKSPELMSLVAGCGLYLVVVRIVTPQYTREMVPLLLDSYWAYGTSSVVALLAAMKLWLLLALMVVAVSLLFLRRSGLFMVAAVFAACSVGSMLAYAQQRADWTYHRYPVWSFLILAAVLFLLGVLQSVLPRWQAVAIRRPVALACLAAVFAVGIGFFPRQLAALRPQRSEVYRFLEKQRDAGTVLVLSTAVFWVADVADLKLGWGARFPCLPFLSAVVQNEDGPTGVGRPFRQLSPEKLAAISSLQRAEMTEDLNHFQPSLVMVEHCDPQHPCQAIEGKSFDTIGWFLQDQQFVEAWKHYRRQPDEPASFDVYARVP